MKRKKNNKLKYYLINILLAGGEKQPWTVCVLSRQGFARCYFRVSGGIKRHQHNILVYHFFSLLCALSLRPLLLVVQASQLHRI